MTELEALELEKEMLELEEEEARAGRAIPVSKEPGDMAQQPQPEPSGGLGSKLLSAARALQKGGSFDFADEAVAALSSIPGIGPYLGTPLDEMAKTGPRPEMTYKENLADTRGAFDASHAENPGLSTGVELATAMFSPGPGKAKGATALARLGKGALANAGVGALFGLGNSRASLAEGELGRAALDTGASAALSGAVGVVPGLGGELLRRISNRAGKGVQKAVNDASAAATSKTDEGIASALGSHGKKAQQAHTDFQDLWDAAANPSHPGHAAALEAVKRPEFARLAERAMTNKSGNVSRRVAEELAAQAEHQAKVSSRGADIATGTAELLENPIRKQVLPRAKLLGNRFIPPIVGAVGGALLGDEGGAAVGGGLGTALSLIQGRPGTVIRNMIHSPGFRKMAFEGLEGAAGKGSALMPLASGAPLAAGASKVSQPLLDELLSLLANDEDKQKAMAEALGGGK